MEVVIYTNLGCSACHQAKEFLTSHNVSFVDIYATCDRLMKAGVTINRPPRDGVMAFVRSPDKHSVELLQKGAALPAQEPWKSMPNTGKW